MSIETRVPQFGSVFGDWQVGQLLSAENGSAVFQLSHPDASAADCVLKVVSVIEAPGSLDLLSPEEQEEYFAHRRSRRKAAEQRMLDMEGSPELLEYTFLDWEDDEGFGRDLLIRIVPEPENFIAPEDDFSPDLPGSQVVQEPVSPQKPPKNTDPTAILIRVLIALIAVATVFVALIFGKIILTLKSQVDQAAMQSTMLQETVLVIPTEEPATEPATEAPTEAPVVLDPTKIVDLSIGRCHTAAVYEDGSVDVVYLSESMRRKYPAWDVWDATEATEWTDIIQVSVSTFHMAGLKSDGTVVAIGGNTYGECNTSEWTDIVAIQTGDHTTVGLRSDGTVVSTGSTIKIGNISYMSDVTAIDMGSGCLEYMQSDGSWKRRLPDGSELNMGKYPGLVRIHSNETDSIGVLSDGTVVVGRTSRLSKTNLAEWTDIVDVYGNASCLLGVKSDGTVRAMGTDNQYNQQNVHHWTGVARMVGPSLALKHDGTLALSGTSLLQSFDFGPLIRAPHVTEGKTGRIYRSSTGVNVRAYPGINCDVVTKLPMDTGVIILEEKATYDGKNWGRTWYGWVSMEYVELAES